MTEPRPAPAAPAPDAGPAPGPRSVIVVGAGTAGCALARRLVDAGRRVTLLEAGGPDTNPAIHDPARMAELWHGDEDWDFFSVPQPHANHRRLHLPRGRVLGGSHALNAMIWVRCAPEDFDGWAAAGNDGWAWADVLPIYRRIEDFSGGASALRGAGGPLPVADDVALDPIQAAMIRAAEQAGHPRNPDYNGERLDGVAPQQVTIRDGLRVTSYRALLGPVLGSPLLEIVTGAEVDRVLLEPGAAGGGPRAAGVLANVAGVSREFRAEEVVLAGGALGSPAVLLRSGIGPAAPLRAVGVAPTVELPGVGENLHDHLLAPVIFATERPVGPPHPGASITQAHLFWRSRPGLPLPDTQPIFFSVPMLQDGMSGPEDGFSLMAGLVTPRGRGRLRLSGPGLADPLRIDLGALAHPDDLASLVASVRNCREIGRQPALAAPVAAGGWGATEVFPGPGVSDAELADAVRETAVTYHHQVGTCAMGSGPLAVVDARLRVRGVAGLRVADASIMPTITTGNTNGPALVIGERAADFLLAGE